MTQTASRYAQALFDIAQEQNNLEAVQTALTNVRSLVSGLENFRRFLSNPLLSFEERHVILKTLFEGKIPDLVYRFMLFINYKNRLNMLKDMIESFDSLYLSSTHQLRAYVTTALPITKEDRDFINQRLCDKFHDNVLTQWEMDSSLIGGFRIFVKGKIYDYSFKNQLNHFLQQATQPV